MTMAESVAISFQVSLELARDHYFDVTLTIAEPRATQILELPVWIPGSYLVREFSRHLLGLRAEQKSGAIPVRQLDKARWQVDCETSQPLVLRYSVYAFDTSVRTAWLDDRRGFFNGTSLLLRSESHAQLEHQLEVIEPSALKWQLATGMDPVRINRRGFGRYRADDYNALVDCPVELGDFWNGTFEVRGIPHKLVVSGAPDSFDGDRLLRDTQAICKQEMDFWHGDASAGQKPPFSSYLFMLNTVAEGYGGLEHRNSTALICGRKDLPRLTPAPAELRTGTPPTHSVNASREQDGYTTLLGLISHEYFHTWNVKRLRPSEFETIRYQEENYTSLLWFFEGFTSYYDDLLLLRAGRIEQATYLKLLSKTINQVLQTPGRLVQSVAQASFDAWIKYYRPDENTANTTVSYYTKGALVALCLDLTIRAGGHGSLDDVMRKLWQRCVGGPMTEADLRAVLLEITGRRLDKELNQWVHGMRDLPLKSLLERHGIAWQHGPDQLAQQWGLRVKEGTGVQIQQVLYGGAAQLAGLAAGDELLAVQADSRNASGPWRMNSLDDVALYCGAVKKVILTIVRDGQLRPIKFKRPQPGNAVRLGVANAEKARAWLG